MSVATAIANMFRIPELRKRILFTVGILAVYRLGIFVSTPGVDRHVMKQLLNQPNSGSFATLFNFFSGGALERLSVYALGIMPYISSSIIMQLLTVVIPTLERLNKEGDQGRRKVVQYTRYGTVVLSIIQGTGIAFWLERLNYQGNSVVRPEWAGWGFRFVTVVSLAAGTAFIMWLGEQITDRGIGNGISLIIFAGIVARLPNAVIESSTYLREGLIRPFTAVGLLIVSIAVIGFIVFMERGQRRIPVQYAKRVVGGRSYGGQATHLPLKVNTSGVIPPIFASSILMLPASMAGFAEWGWLAKVRDTLQGDGFAYHTLYVLLIIFFCYFYTSVTFNPVDVADNLKKFGGYIPGIRPGKATADYIDKVLTRITFGGALYISAVCVLPSILVQQFNVPFQFGGTGLLIVVGVALDTVQQVESHLITHHYDGFTGPRGPRIRGRRVSIPGAPVSP
ncbi:MAG: preprotein translocase subunit SecY [Deltaproteobacteria bacterium]|nr:preprotein translocase subunit SecY [Deltaproteobacteria bacterium]